MLMDGQLPAQAQGIFMLAAPDQMAALTQPMSQVQAESLLSLVPIDFMGTLLEQGLGLEKVALVLLSAHLIIFWLSQDSNVTPPVCLTAFAAATIAGTPPMRTGLTAWKIAKGLYLVPILMAYTSLVSWDVMTVITVGFFAIIGTYAFIAGIEGYLESELNIFLRGFSLLLGLALTWPDLPFVVRVAAMLSFVGLFIYSNRRYKSVVTTPAVAAAVY